MEEFKSFLISLVKVIIPCMVIALVIFILVKIQPEPEVEPEMETYGYDEEGTDIVLENDSLKFVMDTSTTHFYVEDKSNGKIWYSNPTDADNDALALTPDKNNLKSTLLLTYGTINGVWTTYNNYALSIEKGIYDISADDNQIKVRYTVGNVKKEYILPVAVPESRMNELLDLMEKKQQKQVKEYYRKYDIKKLRKTDDKEALLAQYPDLENEPVYVLIDSAADYLKRKIEVIFESIGYTREDYEADLARYETISDQNIPLFNISMVYSLENDRLVVEVPFEEIEWKSDYPIISLEVLPYMGAGNLDDEGYMIIPESGGAVINFNNGRQTQNAYTSQLYGWDYCQSRDAVVTETRCAFPVIAINNNDASFVCIIDEGSAYASVSADISGRNHNYNHASFTYSMLHYASYEMSGKSNSAFYVYEEELPKESIVQKYCFSDSSDYADLALVYRDYLSEKYPGLASGSDASMPLVVDVVQAVDKVQQKFGVPVSAPLALTTYSETVELADRISALGISDYSMRIIGWMNGGVTHDVLSKIKLIRDLGGTKAFNNMLSELETRNVKVYLDGETDFAYNSNILDGFVSFRDAAKYASREEAEMYSFSIVWYGEETYNDSYYLLKPEKQLEYFNTFKDFALKSKVGMSLRDTGYILSADYNPKNHYSREQIICEQRAQMQNAQTEGAPLIIKYGNEYALEYADVVTSMDITNSNNAIIDYDIPFYQIAIHGLVDYTGSPINLSEDYEFELLKSAEFGAGLNFVFMLESSETLQETAYTNYYGASYSLWETKLSEIYSKFSESFDGLFDKAITGHCLVGTNCRKTEYSDGSVVYVNYGYADETVDGVTIPARDYIVKRGEAR